MPFFAKIPCFSLFLTVPFVCREQVFHKPKVKEFLHRQESVIFLIYKHITRRAPGNRGFFIAYHPVYSDVFQKSANKHGFLYFGFFRPGSVGAG